MAAPACYFGLQWRTEVRPKLRKRLFMGGLAAASLLAGQAWGQVLSVDISPGVAPDIGRVTAAASGDTVFRITPDGAVSVVSGSGARVGGGATIAPTVTIRCVDLILPCAGRPITVRVSAGGAAAPAKAVKAFTLDMGTASLAGSVSGQGTNSLSFWINGMFSGQTRTFNLGMDLPVAAYGAGTGRGVASFTVAAGFLTPGVSDSGQAAVTTFRPLSLTKLSDLAFGRVVRPVSGGGGVLSVSASGDRTVTGGGVILNSSFSRAGYEVAGEGGQGLTISVPQSFTMSNPQGASLLVTTTTTAVGLMGLGGAAGSEGTYRFYVGGAFPLGPNTPSGSYSGTFAVTAAYD